jgi:hypothetical protein
MLYYWRDKGCPYLDGRRKLSARPDSRGGRVVWLFRKDELEQVGPLFANRKAAPPAHSLRGKSPAGGEAKRKLWAQQDVIEDGGGRHMRSGAAQRFLGVTQSALSRWSRLACPYLPASRVLRYVTREVMGTPTFYYPLSELEEVKAAMARADAAGPGPDEVTLEEAARRLGVSGHCLRYRGIREQLGLTGRLYPVRHPSGRTSHRLALTVKEVDEAKHRGTDVYITGKQAVGFTGLSWTDLTRICQPGGDVRFRRKGRRLKVHLGDFARWLEKNRPEVFEKNPPEVLE